MNEDVPGLAMSRSLGDYVAQSVGVIPNPEMLEYEITPDDLFMVIASDGVWEFMPNEEVAKISLPFYAKSAPEAAANALVKEAYKKWKQVSICNIVNLQYRKKKLQMTLHASLSSLMRNLFKIA